MSYAMGAWEPVAFGPPVDAMKPSKGLPTACLEAPECKQMSSP